MRYAIRSLHPISHKYELTYSDGRVFTFNTVYEAIAHTEDYNG